MFLNPISLLLSWRRALLVHFHQSEISLSLLLVCGVATFQFISTLQLEKKPTAKHFKVNLTHFSAIVTSPNPVCCGKPHPTGSQINDSVNQSRDTCCRPTYTYCTYTWSKSLLCGVKGFILANKSHKCSMQQLVKTACSLTNVTLRPGSLVKGQQDLLTSST